MYIHQAPNARAAVPDFALVSGAQNKPEPLNVLIVGAGIGGLSAGIALRQQGHNVTLLETSRFSNEVGAAIHIAPNCNGLLKRMGLDIRDVGANKLNYLTIWNPDGKEMMSADLREPNKLWQHEWLLVHRAHLHTALREKAINKEGKGKPCQLKLASKVVAVNPQLAEVTLENGEKLRGDLLLGADGVHSKCRESVKGGEDKKPFDGGQSAFRWMVPIEDLVEDPEIKELIVEKKGDGLLGMVIAPDRRLVWYPCANYKLMNFLLMHPSNESKMQGVGDWQAKGDKQKLQEIGSSFHEGFRKILAKAPEDSLKIWTLLDLEVLPTWINDKLALLGDAAHPFLPHQAQGGAQAIEDGVSLGALLPLGTLKEDVADRLHLYEKCRKVRADRIQQFTRIAGMSIQEQKDLGIDYRPMEFNVYNFNHDEWDYSSNELRKHLYANSKVPYRWRQPVSFGPSPGPRQPLGQLPDVVSHARQHQTVYTIRFKTSKTYLQNLFPNEQFSFFTPGTYAQASFICCSLQNMVWLGDTGYNHCGLYIHGVQYTKKNGEKLQGTFMPMLFENLTDPIITGREEIAAPKWGCDIDISESGSSNKVTMGWRGAVFGEMEFDDLVDASASNGDAASVVPAPSPNDYMLLYRYVPAVGEPGKADAEYAVAEAFQPDAQTKERGAAMQEEQGKSDHIGNAQSKFSAQGASKKKIARSPKVRFQARDWASLPTIHHIAQGLADVPVYEILEGKVEFVPQVGDVRGAKRIE